jgi:hypothetical protein
VSQWCHSGVTVVSQWSYSGATVVLQWCHSGVTVLLRWCHSVVPMLSQVMEDGERSFVELLNVQRAVVRGYTHYTNTIITLF